MCAGDASAATIRAPRRAAFGGPLAATVLSLLLAATASAQPLPERLADSTFWRMVTEFSEPGGYFRSDNFVSNESEWQYVIPPLRERVSPGSVYIGVGPEQNFAYVVGFRPAVAFIVDIRRQNMLQHLMYKAAIELAADRADFLSRLWSRPRPEGLDSTTSAGALLSAYMDAPPDTAQFRRNLAELTAYLMQTKGFTLTDDDLLTLRYIYTAFHQGGPFLNYSFGQGMGGGRGGMGGMPTFADLMLEDDGQGVNRHWLGSEEAYRTLRHYQMRNLIVPVVGNFAGDHALRSVGTWVRTHGAAVSLFYVSNVEQYLFQQGDEWSRFYTNVRGLPLHANATFIRSVASRAWVPVRNPRSRMAQVASPVDLVLQAYAADRLGPYYDVVMLSRW